MSSRKGKAVQPDGKVTTYRPRPAKGAKGGTLGRPTKKGRGVTAIICGRLKGGASIEAACRLAGISVSSHNNWMAAGEQGDKDHENYFREVSKALAESEFVLLSKIRKSDKWQAQAWILAKRFPDQWGNHRALKVLAQDGGKPLQAGPSGVTIIIEGGTQDPDILPDETGQA